MQHSRSNSNSLQTDVQLELLCCKKSARKLDLQGCLDTFYGDLIVIEFVPIADSSGSALNIVIDSSNDCDVLHEALDFVITTGMIPADRSSRPVWLTLLFSNCTQVSQ